MLFNHSVLLAKCSNYFQPFVHVSLDILNCLMLKSNFYIVIVFMFYAFVDFINCSLS